MENVAAHEAVFLARRNGLQSRCDDRDLHGTQCARLFGSREAGTAIRAGNHHPVRAQSRFKQLRQKGCFPDKIQQDPSSHYRHSQSISREMSHNPDEDPDSEPELLAEEDMLEEVPDGDVAMDSDGEGDAAIDDDEPLEIQLQNDSIAYFDQHKDSVFAIAQHPRLPHIIATGGGEGEADDAPGRGYVVDINGVTAPEKPLLPASYRTDPGSAAEDAWKPTPLGSLFVLEGHTDSINALAFTSSGEHLVSGGLDGKLRAYRVSQDGKSYEFVAEAAEVPEVNWLSPCPGSEHGNAIALGASDGSVWVYTIDANAASGVPLQIEQSFFLHQAPCTAGAWTSDGNLLATVAEDSTLYVWDVWGVAAAKQLVNDNGVTVVALTETDQRFAVEGGLYSVAVEPRNAFLAAGGAAGMIRIVGLPRLTDAPVDSNTGPTRAQQALQHARARAGRSGGRFTNDRVRNSNMTSAADPAAQAGVLLASLQAQGDSIETLSFAPSPQTLLAAGSVDGSVVVYDTARSFSVRRSIAGAHEDFSVVKVEFVKAGNGAGWLLTTCGMDGVVRRWDLRGTTAGAGTTQGQGAAGGSAQAVPGLVKEWKGHRGDGEGGGVLGFVQGDDGQRVVTAGDDGVVLVFEA
jgi:ribosome assembly protein SQT1